jgi:hypothetical protein
MRTTTTRPVVAVAGADRLLSDATLRIESGATPRELARWLATAAGGLDLRDAGAATRTAGRTVLLAEAGDGPALGLRWFSPDRPTTIHDHTTWGALLVLAGSEQYERWEHGGRGGVQLAATHYLSAGDTLWWNDPPGDIHRQRGLGDGALELLLLGALSTDTRTFDDPGPVGGVAGALIEAFRTAYLDGSAAPLESWYDDEVLADLFLPKWRTQLRGKRHLLGELDRLEFGQPGHRLTRFRSVPTDDGVLVEVEVRARADGGEKLWQAMHRIRLRMDRIVEHIHYCTGHQRPEIIEQQATEAWLMQP